jgi:hypothetical protein
MRRALSEDKKDANASFQGPHVLHCLLCSIVVGILMVAACMPVIPARIPDSHHMHLGVGFNKPLPLIITITTPYYYPPQYR